MRVSVKDPRFDTKAHYDTLFDELFFTSKFKNEFVSKFKICPQGTTFNTFFIGSDATPWFSLMSKIYGYDYPSSHRVIGDYEVGKYHYSDEMLEFAINYVKENKPDLYDEVKDYEFIAH